MSIIWDRILKCQYSFPKSLFTFPLLISLAGWIRFQRMKTEPVSSGKESHISSFVQAHNFLCCLLLCMNSNRYLRQFTWYNNPPTSRLFNSLWYKLKSFPSFPSQSRDGHFYLLLYTAIECWNIWVIELGSQSLGFSIPPWLLTQYH